jgi:tubulin polyglutamylase TTLL6/13
MGHDVEKIKTGIDDIIIKTLITAQPELSHVYRSCQPEDFENSLCFQVLGFDIMIDDALKPWLIEVNHAPSFATESPFDLQLKTKLLEDTFRILNLTQKKKNY